MVLFKINGERNSGTNFIAQILKQNMFPIYEQKIDKNIIYHWKHGIPRNDFKLLNDKVIDIFIFRPLEEWLTSMYMNVFHLKNYDDFSSFLTEKQQSTDLVTLDYLTNKCVNEDDNNKSIFEIRYYKFKKITEYKENNEFIIFVNMKFLQDEKNLFGFLDKLNSMYMNNSINKNYITKMPHTKTHDVDLKNRIYNLDLNSYKDIINKHKNEEIEHFINNLTVDIK